MGDAEGALPSSKKRFAEGQLSRDDSGLDDEGPEPEMGTFKRANDEVMATRRIVKVRRHQHSAASSNPFAGIRLVPSSESNAKPSSPNGQTQVVTDKEVSEGQDFADAKNEKADEDKGTENELTGKQGNEKELENQSDGSKVEVSDVDKKDEVEEGIEHAEADKEADIGEQEDRKESGAGTEEEVGEETQNEARQEAEKDVSDETVTVDNDQKDKAEPVTSLSSFQQLSSSQNAFTGLAGTGFSSSSFSFGSVSKEGSSFGTSSGSIFGLKNDNTSFPSFSLGSSSNGGPSVALFGAAGKDASKSGGSGLSMQEVPVETGEENEKAVFNADAVMFEYLDGSWKERGKGELRVNISTTGAEKARLVMRARGNYRLILNASLYPDMSLTNMDKRGMTFACVNSAGEGKGGLTTFALKFKDGSVVEEFHGAVTAHKGKKATSLKTPENSPKGSDN